MWASLFLLGGTADFTLRVFHTNDVHAHLEPSWQGLGGLARRVTYMKQARQNYTNSLLLNGGDQFQGTFWAVAFRGSEAAFAMNTMGFDAMTIGNHEFDYGGEGLEYFLGNVTFPVLSANLECEASVESEFPNLFAVQKSTTVQVGGETIGLIGATIESTPQISNVPANVDFSSVIDAVQAQVDVLKGQGVNKIMVMTHQGYSNDVALADAVSDIDVIVGGHTDTFLYTGDPTVENPDAPDVSGPYPSLAANGKTCVVQDFADGIYIGNLEVTFDDSGNVLSCTGNPELITDALEEDPDVLAWFNESQPIYDEMGNVLLGYSYVHLVGASKGITRRTESSVGNWQLDSSLAYLFTEQIGWTADSYLDYPIKIAMKNGGGIRGDIAVGNVTWQTMASAFPYGDEFMAINITGATLLEVLKRSVTAPKADGGSDGHFMQVSGIRLAYDIGLPQDDPKRLIWAEVQCQDSAAMAWCEIEPDTYYPMLINEYIGSGKDGYSMLGTALTNVEPFGTALFSDLQLTEWALQNGMTRRTGLDGRIKVYDSSGSATIGEPIESLCTPYPDLAQCVVEPEPTEEEKDYKTMIFGLLFGVFLIISLVLLVLLCKKPKTTSPKSAGVPLSSRVDSSGEGDGGKFRIAN